MRLTDVLASCILVSVLFQPPCATAAENDKDLIRNDPFRRIEHLQLENGLHIYLAPSDEATLTAIKVAVDTGTRAESPSNWGVAHLLEHVLFRDKELKDEMSYLQLIKEAGGNANGSTSDSETNYYGSIPARKGPWLFEQFTRLILNPEIRPEYVTKEKSTVEIERGRPGALTQLLGYDPRDILLPKYLNPPSFLESEFDVHNDDAFTLAQEQLSTQRLTQKQVQDFYRGYYCPPNMRIFIAGKFDRAAMLKTVNEKWAVLPRGACKTLPELPTPKPRLEPYILMRVTEDTPWIQIGTKVWDTASRDESVIDSYMEYLAHRLMKDMRNRRGQAYSINAQTSIVRRYGYSVLQFHTQKENLESGFQQVQRMIRQEATAGGLSAAQVEESIKLYIAAYGLAGKEAWQMMSMAEQAYDDMRDYGRFESPYMQLVRITPEEYNATLKKYFKPRQSYLSMLKPALLFPYDSLVLSLLTAVFAFMFLRKVLTKPFAHDQIRWVKKLKFPPLKLLEGLLLVLAWYVFAHIYFAETVLFSSITAFRSHILTSVYLQTAIVIITGLALIQGFLSLIPRKLMIVGDQLVVKSLSYYSFRIPLSEIQSIETRRLLGYPFPPSLWLGQVRHRLYFFNPKFWQKGTLIRLRDGRAYFFSLSGFPETDLPKPADR